MIKLYSYWRSTAAYRVRIALMYKELLFDTVTIDLLAGEHKLDHFKNINPHGRVPTLVDGNDVISQSIAILEYLEEQYSEKTILPGSHFERALARNIAQIVVSDIHPLNNSGTLRYLKDLFDTCEEVTQSWYCHWLKDGFDAIEKLITNRKNPLFCVNDSLSMADICLIPQVFNAHMIEYDMSKYPLINAVYQHCIDLDYFASSHPSKQPGFSGQTKIPGSE